jgi:hypothetical protein
MKAVSTSNRSWLQKRVATTAPGKKLDNIIAIADERFIAPGTQARHARAVAIKEKYENIATLRWRQQILKLWDVFNDMEDFYKEFSDTRPTP